MTPGTSGCDRGHTVKLLIVSGLSDWERPKPGSDGRLRGLGLVIGGRYDTEDRTSALSKTGLRLRGSLDRTGEAHVPAPAPPVPTPAVGFRRLDGGLDGLGLVCRFSVAPQ